jgi:hypothetical protein
MGEALFKTCASGVFWKTRDDFLSDRGVTLIGYMVNFKKLELGLFLFNEDKSHSTLSIQAAEFTDLYNGEVFTQRLTGTQSCPGYCLHKDNIDPCPAKCECAFIREVMQIIINWPKK